MGGGTDRDQSRVAETRYEGDDAAGDVAAEGARHRALDTDHALDRLADFLASRPFAVGAASMSFAAAAIHFGVAPDHFNEYAPYGLAFALLGWFQVCWAALYLALPGRSLAIAAAIVNAGVVAVWIYSRTLGLPFGPNAGTPEAVGLADTISSEIEAVLVGAILVRLAASSPGVRASTPVRSRPAHLALAVAVGAAVLAASVLALAALGGSMGMGG